MKCAKCAANDFSPLVGGVCKAGISPYHLSDGKLGCCCNTNQVKKYMRENCPLTSPVTNADFIRKMTDEELSMQIATLVVLAFDQVVPDWTWKVDREMRITGTAKDLLEWLKLPHEESEGGKKT